MGPDGASPIFLIAGVVQETKQRLEGEKDEENNANDWVVLPKLENGQQRWPETCWKSRNAYISKVRGQPDTHAKSNHKRQVSKSLQDRMEPEEAWEAQEPHRDGATWEDDDEG